MMMPLPFLLLIGNNGTILIAPEAQPTFAANNDEAGIAQILNALRNQPKRAILIVADTLEQEIRHEILPDLGSADRQNLIARRMAQHFPNAHLTASLQINKELHLVAALHAGGPIALWLEYLAELPNPSGEICLLPIEAMGMVQALQPSAKEGWSLLLALEATGGYRQILCRDGVPFFTRLKPARPGADATEIAETIVRDIKASAAYLARFGLPDETAMEIVALLPADIHEPLRQMPLTAHKLLLITPHQAATQLRLPFFPSPEAPTSDLVFAGWILNQAKLRMILYETTLIARHQEKRLRHYGRIAAMLFWLIFIVFAGLRSPQIISDFDAYHMAQQSATTAAEALTAEQHNITPADASSQNLREALARQRFFLVPTPDATELLKAIAESFADKAKLTAFDWHNDKGPEIRISFELTDTQGNADHARIGEHFSEIARKLTEDLAPAGYTTEIVGLPFVNGPTSTLSNAQDSKAGDETGKILIKRATP